MGCMKVSDMVKDSPIAFRIEAPMKAALQRAADADDRSLSSMVERILRAWLTEHGHMPATAAPAPKATAKRRTAGRR